MTIVNWASALESAGGDPELLDDVIQAFLEEWRTMLDQIRDAIDTQDAKELQIGGHTIKSSLRIFGCDEASEIAFQIELLGEQGSFAGAAELFEKLSVRTSEAVRELEAGKPNA